MGMRRMLPGVALVYAILCTIVSGWMFDPRGVDGGTEGGSLMGLARSARIRSTHLVILAASYDQRVICSTE